MCVMSGAYHVRGEFLFQGFDFAIFITHRIRDWQVTAAIVENCKTHVKYKRFQKTKDNI